MQLDATGNNLDITAAQLRRSKKVTRRRASADRGSVSPIEKMTRRRLGGDRHLAEINLNANGTTLHADAEDEDMYAAIDAMADKIDRQARRHHGEATDHTAPRAGEVAEQPPGGSE